MKPSANSRLQSSDRMMLQTQKSNNQLIAKLVQAVNQEVTTHLWRHRTSDLCTPPPPRTLFGSGFDSDEDLPASFPLGGGSSSCSRPAYSLPDSDGYFSHGEWKKNLARLNQFSVSRVRVKVSHATLLMSSGVGRFQRGTDPEGDGPLPGQSVWSGAVRRQHGEDWYWKHFDTDVTWFNSQ